MEAVANGIRSFARNAITPARSIRDARMGSRRSQVRIALGIPITLLAAITAVQAALEHLPTPVLASALAGAATGLGAAALFAGARPGRRGFGHVLAASAGLMTVAATGALLGPALRLSTQPIALDAWLALAAGFGAIAWIGSMGKLAPSHQKTADGRDPAPTSGGAGAARRATVLAALAIALHNLPEGFAVGAGFGLEPALGWSTAAAIGLQNVPEGALVALALWAGAGTSRIAAGAGALASGLVEPLGAALGWLSGSLAPVLLPAMLAAAAGMMLRVVLAELLPQLLLAQGRGARVVTAATGATVMFTLL